MEHRPPGWSRDPSTWVERIPIAVLATIGFGIAAYLALYQYGLVRSAWDPFFGDQTERVLDSPLSRVLPVPDAALGAAGYLLDAVTAVIGGRGRWRTMPWIVVLFGIAIGPLGMVSLALVMAQPLAYDAWCTLCLATAVISVVMIPPAMDEVLATLQHLRRNARRGRSVWRLFWGLDTAEAA